MVDCQMAGYEKVFIILCSRALHATMKYSNFFFKNVKIWIDRQTKPILVFCLEKLAPINASHGGSYSKSLEFNSTS